MEVEYGYNKCSTFNMPKVRSDAVYKYIAKISPTTTRVDAINIAAKKVDDDDLRVDYVELRRTAEICDISGIVFRAMEIGNEDSDSHAKVALKFDQKQDEILEAECDKCKSTEPCPDILAFVFWLYRKSNDTDGLIVSEYWGDEITNALQQQQIQIQGLDAVRMRDILPCNDLRLEADMELTAVGETEGIAFVEAILDGMEDLELRDSLFYRHCRPVNDQYDPILLHNIMLEAANHSITDSRSLCKFMEDHAKLGLFERFAEASKQSYKSKLWYEAQYMRLRCSLIQSIASRRTPSDEDSILDQLFCKSRQINQEARQQLKQHKRFILKQTEKLENKIYQECGLLISDSYPYICASPDGITDDHIVEIKSPKTEEEFERYLEGRETIAPKYMAQIQIQMFVANMTKALYCVLSPTFDTNGALHYVWVQADMEFVAGLLSAAEDFWRDVVFPRLCKLYPCVQ